MAELVDAPDLGSGDASRGGSTPSARTSFCLWHDGSLFKLSTWSSAWRHLFAKGGLFRESFGLWRDYFKPGFHPSQHPDQLSKQWLQQHADAYTPVAQAA